MRLNDASCRVSSQHLPDFRCPIKRVGFHLLYASTLYITTVSTSSSYKNPPHLQQLEPLEPLLSIQAHMHTTHTANLYLSACALLSLTSFLPLDLFLTSQLLITSSACFACFAWQSLPSYLGNQPISLEATIAERVIFIIILSIPHPLRLPLPLPLTFTE